MKYYTINDALTESKGIGPGFDLLRLILSVLIFYAHTKFALVSSSKTTVVDINMAVTGAVETRYFELIDTTNIYMTIVSRGYVLYVPVFFALSGFLVTSSAFRLGSIKKFIFFRALRIFPALIVETFISAILLGVLFSSLSLHSYITHPDFLRYFGNIVGFVSFTLPGVFENNPRSGLVNVNLWTLPAEFYCYLLLSLLMLLGFLRKTKGVVIIVLAISCLFAIASVTYGIGVRGGVYSTENVVFHFLVGSIFYLFRIVIPLNAYLLILSLLVVVISLVFSMISVISAPCVAYVTVYLGLSSFLKLDFLKNRDYSYGIYLYGFPITQALVSLNGQINRFELFVSGIILTILVASISWHFVEKPSLKLRR